MIRNTVDWRGETLSRLRGLIMTAGPAMVEEVKWKKPSRPEGVPAWSHGGLVCMGEMLKRAVRLTFPKGAQIEDPAKLFNARLDSQSVRAIDFHEGQVIPEADLKAVITDAVRLNVAGRRPISTSNGQVLAARGIDEGTSCLTAPRAQSGHTISFAERDGGPTGRRRVPGGVVHKLPLDLRTALVANPVALAAWMDITPLARNEFICWVEDAKQDTTRVRRMNRLQEELEEGQRRPCCWPGCKHRQRTGR
jgi:hypothetical protein